MTKKTFKANKAVNLKNFITKLYLKINKKQNDRKCTRQYKKTIFNSDDLFILINQRIRINRTAWQIHAVMQMGGSGFGVAGFADVADGLAGADFVVKPQAGVAAQMGVIMPRARPLDADEFAAQPVAADFGNHAVGGAAHGGAGGGEDVRAFVAAAATAGGAPGIGKPLAFNRIDQALRRGRVLRAQAGDFANGLFRRGAGSQEGGGCKQRQTADVDGFRHGGSVVIIVWQAA